MTYKIKALAFSAALAVGSLTTAMMPATASAMTLNLSPLVHTTDSASSASLVEKVGHRAHRRAHRREHRRFVYNRHRHGHRYRYRTHRHRHYYNGYYYAIPFWLGAAALTAPYYAPRPVYSGSRHVAWCHNRYRSYNPATDTFRGYDGYDHRCRSPYHP